MCYIARPDQRRNYRRIPLNNHTRRFPHTFLRQGLRDHSARATNRAPTPQEHTGTGISPNDELVTYCINQQPPQRGGAVPDPVWVGSKWLLAFPRIPVTPGIPLHFFAMLPLERPQEGSTQHLQNRSPVFTFSSLLPYSWPSSSPHSFSSPDER